MEITEYKCSSCGKTYTLIGDKTMEICTVCGSTVNEVPLIVYKCRNCGNEYTFYGDHKEDRCSNCGSFLIALPPKPVINADSFKRVVLLNALYNDLENKKGIQACNLEVFQDGRHRIYSGEQNLMTCPDHLVTEYELIPMKSSEHFTFIYKFRRKIDSPENAIKEYYLINKYEAQKVQTLSISKSGLYKLSAGENLPRGSTRFNGQTLSLDEESSTRIIESFSGEIKNEFIRLPEEIEKAKREQERIRREEERKRQEEERIRREEERKRQELESNKQKVATLPKYLEDLRVAEADLEDAKKHRGLFGGKRVKEAERKVQELKDYIARLERIKRIYRL